MKYLIIILGLVSLFFVAHSAVAQDMGVTASEVVDRETLKAFVEGAKDSLESTANFAEVARLVEVFRSEGDWKAGSIYIFVINTDGVVFFHGADPSLDGQNLIDLEDINGVKIVQEIIAAGAAGGGFVEYYWDNPAVEGDEDTQSPKLTYAIPINIFGQDFVVGAGIYLDSDTAFNGAGLVDVQVVGDGDVSGLTVEVSRSIAGRVPSYAWHGTTDEMGRAVVRVMADDQSSVNGMYQARLRSTDGAIIANWSSIPIVPGSRVTYEVNLNGDVRFINPSAASLSQNHPNPFNPATTIRYSLGEAVNVKLAIYNILGQEVRLLVQQFQSAGNYTVVWDGRDAVGRQVSTGMYMYRLQAGADVVTRKMLLAK